MVKIGVIGLGHMGGFHASICSALPHVQLVGVSDPNPESWKKVHASDVIKSEKYTDWIDHVDGVIIAVPTAYHYPIAKECLSLGKHVLIEKPITSTIEQAEELFALAQQKKCTLHVGHVERFNGAVQELKKVIDTPYLIESHRVGPFSPRVKDDSVVLDLMIHDLDIILNLVDSPVIDIHALGQKVHTTSCDIATVLLHFKNGVIASITSSRAAQIKQRSMAVHQKNEYVYLDFTTQDVLIHRQSSSSVLVGKDQLKYRQDSHIERVFVYKDNPLKLEIEHFVSAIKTGTHMVNPEQDIAALKVTFDIERLLGVR